MVSQFSQSDTFVLQEGNWESIVSQGLLLLFLMWNPCPVSKLEQGWLEPSSRIFVLLWRLDQEGAPVLCHASAWMQLLQHRADERWEMLPACPSWSESIVWDWELRGKGAPFSWLHLPRIELRSHWAGEWEAVRSWNATDSGCSYYSLAGDFLE